MKHEYFPAVDGAVRQCQIGRSRLIYRGPPRVIEGDFVACLGATEIYAPELERPFTAVLEPQLGIPVLNMGCRNAGADAFLKDPGALDVALAARVKVLHLMGAETLSNRLYTVHPRRNDRFLRARPDLIRLYPEVDFSAFAFIRHMLGALRDTDLLRFEAVEEELQRAWCSAMLDLVHRLGADLVLLDLQDDEAGGMVTPDMVNSLLGPGRSLITVPMGAATGAARHQKIARALEPPIKALLG